MPFLCHICQVTYLRQSIKSYLLALFEAPFFLSSFHTALLWCNRLLEVKLDLYVFFNCKSEMSSVNLHEVIE